MAVRTVRLSEWPSRLGSPRTRAFFAATSFDTASLWAASLASALLGLGLWWPATRMLPPQEMGTQWPAVSLATLIGALSTLGSGLALIRYIPDAPVQERYRDLRGAIALTTLVAGIASACSLVVLPRLITGMPGPGAPLAGALFSADVVASALGALADEASLALGRSRLIAERALIFGVARIVAAGPFLIGGADWALLAADAAATAAAAGYAWTRLLGRDLRSVALSPASVRLRLRFSISAWLAGALLLLPVHALPAAAARALGAEEAGILAPAWLIITFSRSIPTGIASAVYAVAARERAARAHLSLAALVGGIVSAFAGTAIAAVALAAFPLVGEGYRASAPILGWLPAILSLWYLLALAMVPPRLEGRPWRALPAGAAAALVGLGTAPVLLAGLGLQGAAVAYALGLVFGIAVHGIVLARREWHEGLVWRGEKTPPGRELKDGGALARWR